MVGVGALLGCGTGSGPNSAIPVRIIHGQEAGPLDVGDITGNDFTGPLTLGEPFEYGGMIIHNTSSHDVRVSEVRPYRLSYALQLLALQAWLIPKDAHEGLPLAWRVWPLEDPRARSAVPARNFTVPGHRHVQILFGLRPRRVGVFRLEGARLKFVASGQHYDWTLRDILIARVKAH